MEADKKALLWGLELSGISVSEEASLELLKQKLAAYLDQLLQHDFNALINFLYRIDLSEGKVRTALANKKPVQTEGEILAALCIERLKQKLITRKKYGSEGSANL